MIYNFNGTITLQESKILAKKQIASVTVLAKFKRMAHLQCGYVRIII
jgi:hypothetical protein